MIRITKEGMMPVEIRDLPLPAERLIVVVMEPSVRYGGTVLDEHGEPLSNVAVRIRARGHRPPHQWTRLDSESLTDENGRWQSPPMPARPDSIRCELAHPAYSSGSKAAVVHKPSVDELRAGESELPIQPSGEGKRVPRHKRPPDGRRPGYDPFRIFRKIS